MTERKTITEKSLLNLIIKNNWLENASHRQIDLICSLAFAKVDIEEIARTIFIVADDWHLHLQEIRLELQGAVNNEQERNQVKSQEINPRDYRQYRLDFG